MEKNRTSKSLLAGKFALMIILAGKNKSHCRELVDIAGRWEQLSLEIQLIIFLGDFEFDIINSFSVFYIMIIACSCVETCPKTILYRISLYSDCMGETFSLASL